jgi:hypothetical protein
MARVIVPTAEEILDKEFPVLDKGFVRLVDYMGGDERIVQAARVSYGSGTKTVREDKGLINYLMRHRQDPLPHRHLRQDTIHQVGGFLRQAPAMALPGLSVVVNFGQKSKIQDLTPL